MTEKHMRLAVTGHRPQKLGNEWLGVGPYSDWLRIKLVATLAVVQPRYLYTGMALGFDQLAAEVAIERGICVIAAIPHEGQEKVWTPECQERYQRILAHPLCASTVLVSPGGYHPEKMKKRNRFLVDQCGMVCAAWDGNPSGGTWNCVSYARTRGVPVVMIDPEGWRRTVSSASAPASGPGLATGG